MKKGLKILILLAILAVSIYISLYIGFKENITTSIFNIFEMTNKTSPQIFEILRFPRMLKAATAGSCLALAGMFIQSVSKNPLAEPYLTGISSGAALGIISSIMLLNSQNYPLFGFLGAIITSIIVIALSGINKYSITKLILVGLSLNIFVGSIISLIIILNPEKSYIMMLILSGGISDNNIISSKLLITMFAVSLLACMYCIPKLNFLRLDENMIISNKYQKKANSIIILVISSLLTSISVFSAGIIGFVGIIIPQISKMIFGEDFRWLFFSNLTLGASLMLFADFLTRTLIYPLQLPLGLVIAFIGAPVFIFFLVKKGEIFND